MDLFLIYSIIKYFFMHLKMCFIILLHVFLNILCTTVIIYMYFLLDIGQRAIELMFTLYRHSDENNILSYFSSIDINVFHRVCLRLRPQFSRLCFRVE